MIRDSKDSKQNIRYLGFETTPDGGRRFDFSITATGHASTRVTLDIPGQAYTGDNRITYQESAKICYEKLRVLLESPDRLAEALQIDLTREEIARVRHIRRGRARAKD